MLYGVTCKISNNTSTAMDNQSSYIASSRDRDQKRGRFNLVYDVVQFVVVFPTILLFFSRNINKFLHETFAKIVNIQKI